VSVPWLHRFPLIDDKRRWRLAIRECRHEWSSLFPFHEPHSGDDLDGYLSDAVLQ
jgi:hypothetical protein